MKHTGVFNKTSGEIFGVLALLAAFSISVLVGDVEAYAQDNTRAAATKATRDDILKTHNPFTDAIRWAQKRVVKIYGGAIGREHGYATGIVVSKDGLILVAHGVYVTGVRIQIVMPDGRVYPASIVRRSEPMQVVLLKIDAKTPDYFELEEKPVALRGDWVLSVSNVFKVADRREELSVNMGIMSLRTEIDAKKRAVDIELEGDVLLIDAITSNPGNPGGALITADQKLAGIVGKLLQSKSTNTWLNYAVPSDRLKDFVEGKKSTLVKDPGSDAKPFVGIRVFKLNKRSPAYVDRVLSGSPAAKAGLKSDDLILAIDGEVIRNVAEYSEFLATLKVGQEVVVIFKRKNDVFSVKLTPVPVAE